jgi:hypothetical protein
LTAENARNTAEDAKKNGINDVLRRFLRVIPHDISALIPMDFPDTVTTAFC